MNNIKEKVTALQPLIEAISLWKKQFGYNPVDNYHYRIVQAVALAYSIDLS